ncbi:MAG: hypothetical protein LBJ08_12475 [Bifidobacteriaceae bacterium]|jgi:hypothetical protein|nr:hypothetical protein [Bifidobacteriaceae bacterium]
MTFVLIAVALIVAVLTWAGVTGRFDVSFEESTAQRSVRRARERARIAREDLVLFTPPSTGSTALFPLEDLPPEEDDGESWAQPDWRPTENGAAGEGEPGPPWLG